MVYDGVLKGRFVELKSITLDDVQFSYDIRLSVRDTVGVVAKTPDDQKQFIEWQMKAPDDYYFVVHNKQGEKIGLIGIYSIHDDIGEMGREVNAGSCVEVIEAQILVQDFAMDVLGLKKLSFVIYSNNTKNLKNQKHFGVPPLKKVIRSGKECYYYEFELSKDTPLRKTLAKVDNTFLA